MTDLFKPEDMALLKTDAAQAVLCGDDAALADIIGVVAKKIYQPMRKAGIDEGVFIETYRYLAVKDLNVLVGMLEHVIAWAEKEYGP